MTKSIIVSDDEFAHVETVFQDVCHKLAGRERSHSAVEIEYNALVDTCFCESRQLHVGGRKHPGHIVSIDNLARMTSKCNDRRGQTTRSGYVNDMPDKVLMAAMNTIEEADCGYCGRKRAVYFMHDYHDLLLTTLWLACSIAFF